MARIELVFFEGCPKYSEAKEALIGAGIQEFLEVSQDRLPTGDPRKTYSSPSLVVGGQLVIGHEGDKPSCSLQRWDSEAIRRALAK